MTPRPIQPFPLLEKTALDSLAACGYLRIRINAEIRQKGRSAMDEAAPNWARIRRTNIIVDVNSIEMLQTLLEHVRGQIEEFARINQGQVAVRTETQKRLRAPSELAAVIVENEGRPWDSRGRLVPSASTSQGAPEDSKS